MKEYIVSNLVMENSFIGKIKNNDENNSRTYSETAFGDIKVYRVNIKNRHEEIEYNCKRGRHITVYTPEIWRIDEHDLDAVSDIISSEIKNIVSYSLNTNELSGKKILVIGMGNRQITPDAIGPLTVEKVNATRHIELMDRNTFSKSGMCSVSVMSCGVMGETGMRTLEVIKGVAEQIRPDIVIAVDALAARECARLASTVQISDSGISPGAGIGNRQAAVNRETVGVPVIAIGVPTVVSAATMIGEAMRKCGETKFYETHRKILDEGKNYFVAPKECDMIAESVSRLLATSLDKAFGVI